jgi:hypothetical protein
MQEVDYRQISGLFPENPLERASYPAPIREMGIQEEISVSPETGMAKVHFFSNWKPF